MASLIQWTWVWASSRSWWQIGKPDLLQSVGSQRVWHDWMIELTDWLTQLKTHIFPTLQKPWSLRVVLTKGGGGLVVRLCPTLVTPWAVACQAPLSMGFSRQEYWSGLPFPSPGDLPDPGIEPGSPALQADSLPTELWGKPLTKGLKLCKFSGFQIHPFGILSSNEISLETLTFPWVMTIQGWGRQGPALTPLTQPDTKEGPVIEELPTTGRGRHSGRYSQE